MLIEERIAGVSLVAGRTLAEVPRVLRQTDVIAVQRGRTAVRISYIRTGRGCVLDGSDAVTSSVHSLVARSPIAPKTWERL